MKSGYGIFVNGIMVDWFAYQSAAVETAKELAKAQPAVSFLVKKVKR